MATVFRYYLIGRRMSSQTKRENDEFLFGQYQDLIDDDRLTIRSLRSRVTKVEEMLRAKETALTEALVENIKLKAENNELKKRRGEGAEETQCQTKNEITES